MYTNSPTDSTRPPVEGEAQNASDGLRSGASCWTLLPMFGITFISFVLLTLTTFSLPLIPRLYFLWSDQAGGVRFGIWGWCMEEGSICSERLGMGYTWEPEIALPITKALALYPVGAIFSLMTLISFIPVLRNKTPRTLRVLTVLAWSSFAIAVIVFVFMIAMWSVADERFKAAGWKVHWGPLPWMSFIATMLSLISAIHSSKIASPSTSSVDSDTPFLAEGWSPTVEEDQKIRSDVEKAPALPNVSASSSPFKDFAIPGSGANNHSRTTDDLDRKPSHR